MKEFLKKVKMFSKKNIGENIDNKDLNEIL